MTHCTSIHPANKLSIPCQKKYWQTQKIVIKSLKPMKKSFLPPWLLMACRPIASDPWQWESPWLIADLLCYICLINQPFFCPPFTLNSDKCPPRVQWLDIYQWMYDPVIMYIQWNPSGKGRNVSLQLQNLVHFHAPFFLEIMLILPLMTDHLFWKATTLSGLYRGVPP